MYRKMIVAMALLALAVFFSSGASHAFTGSGGFLVAHEHHHDDAAPAENEVCPVSGEKIGKETNITYEYKGKTYRFCCPQCVEEFKKDPEKYIEKMKKQKKDS